MNKNPVRFSFCFLETKKRSFQRNDEAPWNYNQNTLDSFNMGKMFFYTETREIVFEEPRKCKLTQSSIALSIKNEWTKFFTSFTPEVLRFSQDSKADGLMDSFVRGCKDKHIYVKKKNVRYRNYKPKIISISLAFQYLTIKYLNIGYFNIDYLVKCTNCYNISRGKGTFTSLSYQNQFFSPFQSFCPSRRVLNPIS